MGFTTENTEGAESNPRGLFAGGAGGPYSAARKIVEFGGGAD
jgi:hypothetical protein